MNDVNAGARSERSNRKVFDGGREESALDEDEKESEREEGLREVRREIEEIDREILDAVTRRTDLGERVVELKRENDMEIGDREREREILDEVREVAEERGLDPDLVEEVYEILIELNKQRQRSLL
ncbi:MAG: chorismate mutase [Halobacteria archaeon]